MNRKRLLGGLSAMAATGLMAAAVVPGQATAAESAPPGVLAGCSLQLGSITAGGDQKLQTITQTPPAAGTPVVGPKDLFADGAVWGAGTQEHKDFADGTVNHSGYIMRGTELYQAVYRTKAGNLVDGLRERKIGGGWYKDNIKGFDESWFGTSATGYAYAANPNTLDRWTIKAGVWSSHRVYPGFGAIKAMTMISQTATYDSFLLTLKNGQLYSVRVPHSGAIQVKLVRPSTWGGFERMIAEKCGSSSTLLLGIDKETKSGYLYAVGNANGTSTTIQSLGKVPATFDDPTYFRYKAYGAPALNGD